MKYFSKEIIIPIAGLIAIVCLVYMEKIWSLVTGWSPSIIVAVLSVFVAGCALGVTVWQGRQNDKHNRLSVKPFLITYMKFYSKDKIKYIEFGISNNGIGPAVVTDVMLFFEKNLVAHNNHQDYKNAFVKILEDFGGKTTKVEPNSMIGGRMIAIGERKMLWRFQYNSEIETPKAIDSFKELYMRIEYCSMYGDKMPPVDTR